MVPHGTLKVVFVGPIFKIDSRLEIVPIPSGFPKGERQDGRSWIWDGASLLIMNPRSESLSRMFLTSTTAATDQVSTSQGGILCFALSSRSNHAGLVRKRVPNPLLSSPDFELA